MLKHRNVVRLIKNENFQFDFNEKDVWTMFHSVAFDFSVWELYASLLYGSKLILVPEATAKDPNKFLELLRSEKVTVLNQTPTYFYNLLDRELLNKDKFLFLAVGSVILYLMTVVSATFIINMKNNLRWSVHNPRLLAKGLIWPIIALISIVKFIIKTIKAIKERQDEDKEDD